jgi:hypothetical protein
METSAQWRLEDTLEPFGLLDQLSGRAVENETLEPSNLTSSNFSLLISRREADHAFT